MSRVGLSTRSSRRTRSPAQLGGRRCGCRVGGATAGPGEGKRDKTRPRSARRSLDPGWRQQEGSSRSLKRHVHKSGRSCGVVKLGGTGRWPAEGTRRDGPDLMCFEQQQDEGWRAPCNGLRREGQAAAHVGWRARRVANGSDTDGAWRGLNLHRAMGGPDRTRPEVACGGHRDLMI